MSPPRGQRDGSALNARHQRFVDEYLVDLNATQAAIRAGYSRGSAKVTGHRMLTNANVAAAVRLAQEERAQRVGITQDEVLAELKRIGFSDMRWFADWGAAGVALKESSVLSDDAARCVAEVSQSVSEGGGSIRFKLHDKVRALELAGRHIGMWKDEELDRSKVPLLVVGTYEDLQRLAKGAK